MATYQSIDNIRALRDEIRKKIKNIDLKLFQNQAFGPENEYQYRGLIGGIDSLMTDISTLTRYENKFIKLSDYQDRKEISTDLENILTTIEIPSDLFTHVESLKKKLRQFNLRSFSENLIKFEEEIDNVRKIKLDLQEVFQDCKSLEEGIDTISASIGGVQDEIQESLDQAREKYDEIIHEIERFTKINNEQRDLNTRLDIVKEKAEEQLTTINALTVDSESNKKLIDSFANKVQEREIKLTEIDEKTTRYIDTLESYKKEHRTILAEAEHLIESAKNALNYKTAEGLSDSFTTQHTNASKWWKLFTWILGAILCLIGTLALGFWIMHNIEDEWFMILGRIFLLPVPIAGAVFCANQYTKQKNIIEDYAYKATIAKALVGFSEQLKKNGNEHDQQEYSDYVQKALAEIHKDPLRSRKGLKMDSGTESQLDRGLDLARKIIELSKTNG